MALLGMTRRFLVCGAAPGAAAGNATSTQVLCDALNTLGGVDVLTHVVSPIPNWNEVPTGERRVIKLGVQPTLVHAESSLPGWLFRNRLRAANYDLIWAVNSRYAGVARASGLPYLVWEATPIRDELRTIALKEVRRSGRGSGVGLMLHRASLVVGERLERRALASAVRVFAMSEYTRQRLLDIHRLPASHVDVLLHPPSRAFLDALRRHGGCAARSARALAEVPRLLFVGRADDPRKNLALLFDACRCLEEAGLPVQLSVVGPHTERWAQAQRLGPNVELLGELDVEQLAAQYLSHDALVLPSRQEGFGIVVAEALHAGLPVVSTPCGGPEEVLHRSGAGVVAGFAANDLASAIRSLIGNHDAWHEASSRGLAFAASELSLGRLTERVQWIVSQTMGERSNSSADVAATVGP
jgi:glycosyltransferase involved in cell wall biosynthesis